MPPRLPSGNARDALAEMVRIWGRLDALEEQHRINQAEGVGQREPDLGFAWSAYRWASGHGLDAVLRDADMPAGQIAVAAPDASPVRRNARKAVDALLRGVVAYSSVG
jgi:ATP-dependent RNA helicase HelY